MIRQLIKFGKAVLVVAVTVTLLAACNSEGGSDAGDVVISGSVGDGPVTGATITTYNAKGEQLTSVTSDIYAKYRSKIRFKGREYPLTMEVSGGIDLVTGATPDFTLYSVAMSRKEKRVNINPFTTLAVNMARLMPGGINADNIDTAMLHVTSQLGFGLDLNIIGDPRTTRITDENVANIVKASEAMGEMIRRVRDSITSTGTVVTGDDVMAAIAADLVDSVMDGVGVPGIKPPISAVANVVSGQVLVEALSNSLKVGGVIATNLIDQAILLTHLDINSNQMTDSVRITGGMLQQTQVALAAARVLDASVRITEIATSINGISAGSLPEDVVTVVPADTSGSLDNAVLLASTANVDDVSSVNNVVHVEVVHESTGSTGTGGTGTGSTGTGSTGGGTAPVNTAPVISGSPAGSVVESNAYSFQPVAADADGNVLAFSIANKPGWASFSDTTGRLDGTPADGDTGSYNNIVIAVTDGLDTASLTAFSIRVDAAPVPTGSFTLNWTAPVARSDGSPLSLAEIDSYRIYYGSSPGSYPNSMKVTDGSAQSATVTDVPAADYRVVMTTVDDAGRESANSAEITKTVQ